MKRAFSGLLTQPAASSDKDVAPDFTELIAGAAHGVTLAAAQPGHIVPLVENPALARSLYASVALDQEIPPEHCRAVAEIINYVFRLKGKPRPG